MWYSTPPVSSVVAFVRCCGVSSCLGEYSLLQIWNMNGKKSKHWAYHLFLEKGVLLAAANDQNRKGSKFVTVCSDSCTRYLLPLNYYAFVKQDHIYFFKKIWAFGIVYELSCLWRNYSNSLNFMKLPKCFVETNVAQKRNGQMRTLIRFNYIRIFLFSSDFRE